MNNWNHTSNSIRMKLINHWPSILTFYSTSHIISGVIYFGEKLKKNDANLGSTSRTQLQLRISFHAVTTRVTFLTQRSTIVLSRICLDNGMHRLVKNVTLVVTAWTEIRSCSCVREVDPRFASFFFNFSPK